MKLTVDRALLIVIIGIMIFKFFCGKPNDSFTSTTHDTTITYDSSQHEYTHTEAEFTHHEVDSHYFFPVFDSALFTRIVEAYFKAHVYDDTIRDSAAQIQAIIRDTVTQNSIRWRRVWLKNLRPVATVINNTTTIDAPRNKLFIGGFVGGGFDDGLALGARLTWMNKREDLLNLSYEPFRKEITIGYDKKIVLRRHGRRARDSP